MPNILIRRRTRWMLFHFEEEKLIKWDYIYTCLSNSSILLFALAWVHKGKKKSNPHTSRVEQKILFNRKIKKSVALSFFFHPVGRFRKTQERREAHLPLRNRFNRDAHSNTLYVLSIDRHVSVYNVYLLNDIYGYPIE